MKPREVEVGSESRQSGSSVCAVNHDQVTEQRLCQEASGSKGGWAGGGPEVRAPEGTVLNRSLVKSLLL